MTERVKRRLTTVLCADVQGYTRLMAADEAGTLSRLRRCRAAMAALVERHDGRIVNTWGDAVIAEFASVVEAVQCAVETQQELSGLDHDLPEAQRMRFRIGINLGDVIVDGNDIYGDGVNIAARLQEMAEPGGIMISGPVYDQVHKKLSLGFDCLGWQQVKNVAAPVISYRVMLSGPGVGSQPSTATVVDSAPRADGAGEDAAGVRPHREKPPPSREETRAVSARLARLPRPIAAILVICVFLFLINVFSGLHRVWFHWPVASLMLIGALWVVLRGRPAQDRKERRRMGGR